MLIDPLPLKTAHTPGTALGNVVLTEISAGRSVRTGADGSITGVTGSSKLTISHSVSKENKGQVTDRTAIRLEVRKTLDSGDDAIAQVTVTASQPRLGFTAAEVFNIASILVGSLEISNDPASGTLMFERVLNGEP